MTDLPGLPQLPPPAPDFDPAHFDPVNFTEDLGEAYAAPSAPRGPAPLTPDDLAAIERNVSGLIEAAAAAGADTVPPPVRDLFQESFTSSRLIRAGVQASGIGSALHELLPSGGEAAAGAAPVRQLHPVARVALGLLVLGVGLAFQRKQVLHAYETSTAHTAQPGGPLPGSAGPQTVHQHGGA